MDPHRDKKRREYNGDDETGFVSGIAADCGLQ
jgi:hypothetical protein